MKKFFVSVAVAVVLILIACGGGGLTFKKMVTDKVIEKAIADLAEDVNTRGDHSDTKFYGITYSGGLCARHAVYRKEIGEGYYNLLYASLAAARDNFNPEDRSVKTKGGNKQTYDKYREILKVARETLETPLGLKTAYLLHKEKVITEIKKHGIVTEVEMELTEILPYFLGKVACEDAALSERNAYEWVLRRKVEGGPDLVCRWAWVIQDMRDSLSAL